MYHEKNIKHPLTKFKTIELGMINYIHKRMSLRETLHHIDVSSAHETSITGELGRGHRSGCGKGWGKVVDGAAPGRVREEGTQLGGVGERCKLPHRGLWRSPRSQRFLRRNPPKFLLLPKHYQNYILHTVRILS